MSLGVVIKGPEGIVLAADSRVTLQATVTLPGATAQQHTVNFDNATKLLTFSETDSGQSWVAAVTYGDAVIGTKMNDLRTAHSLLSEFEAQIGRARLSVQQFAEGLAKFFLDQWTTRGMPDANEYPGAGMTFAVAGIDEGAAYGRVFVCNIPKSPKPEEQSPGDFGITFGGQGDFAGRLLLGYDLRLLAILQKTLQLSPQQLQQVRDELRALQANVPWGILPLQDCIDLAIHLVKTTIASQDLSIGIRGVGGPIDVAVITPRGGVQIIQRKQLVGETSTQG